MAEKVNGVPIPASADELGEMYHDPKVFAKVYADKDASDEFIRKYAASMIASDPELQAQLDTQIQMGVAKFIGEDGEARENIGARLAGGRPQVTVDGATVVARGKGAVYNKYSAGAQLEQKYKAEDRFGSIGEICMAIREEARPTAAHNRLDLLRKLQNVRTFQNSFGSEDPGAGGFLIPEIMRAELLQLALEESIVRSRATVIPMSTLRVPIPTVDDTSHVSSVFGGVTYYWAEESSSLPESQASFGKVVLDAKKLVGFFKVPNELLADAPAFSSWFDTRIPAGLAWSEDVAFMTETGAGTPEGFIGSPGYVQVDRTTINTITWADIVTMYSRMLPQSLNSAVWILAHDAFPAIAQLSLSTPGIWMGGWAAKDASDAPPVSIMGRPVFFTEKVPSMLTSGGITGDISFVDLSYYLVGDRQAVAVSASEHAFFQNDMTAYRIIERVDGRPWLQTALTPHNGSASTLSAYVGLSATHT
jgi:HK97 family phage major capsid protein